MQVNFSKKADGDAPICMISLKAESLPEVSVVEEMMDDLFPDSSTNNDCIRDTTGVKVWREQISWTVDNKIIIIKIQYRVKLSLISEVGQQCVQSDVESIAETLKTAFSVYD